MAAPQIFDRKLLARRRARAAAAGHADDVLLPLVAEDLGDRLSAVLRDFPLAIDLGTPGPDVAATVSRVSRVGTVFRVADTVEALPSGTAVLADAEHLPFGDQSLDLVVSALALHWVNDLPGTLIQIRRSLKPDGLFLAAMVGGDTLTELRQSFAQAESEVLGGLSPRVAPFVDVRDLGALLQRAGFALPVTDVDRLTFRFGSIFGLFRDLRLLAATNVLAERLRQPLSRRLLARAAEIYAERFSDPDGRLRATVDIVWLSGWAPHESQQKPQKPGSAKMRLADALGTTEIKTGDKTGR
ncbi:methyltransferase [Agaricicola taiwanensis]|uniref:Methyltransferase n=1 Tax=Agaricicola taiwanensis TaxID=591372 RepID=A0A8J2YMP4_9RHOB|nr:methyltransferase domain-containing protein [Agaricicola taiwanensis]GGE52791.1 methyltransferase [Agaricicola taiwanensis]